MTEETVTVPPPLNDGFDQPHEVSDVLLAFPGSVSDLMPPMSSIPEEFQNMNDHTDWNKFVTRWFFSGDALTHFDLYTREDVDAQAAWKHLSAVLRSWEPKHEHKQAAVAWLMSRWFLAIRPTRSVSL